jgi:protein TonB
LKSKNPRRQNFIKKPHLEGGKEYLREFLNENLKYPKEALEKGIQGDVFVGFSVNQFGEVLNPQVIKGIGYGCDEEAIRVIKLLKYQEVKNRGLRVTTSNKMKIPFRLKETSNAVSIVYTTTQSEPVDKKNVKVKKVSKPLVSYSYTIEFKSS